MNSKNHSVCMAGEVTAILKPNGYVCLLGELESEYKRKNWDLGASAIALTGFAVAFIRKDGTVDTQWYQDYFDEYYDYDNDCYREVYHTGSWRNVSVIRAGEDHVVGLTDSGRVYATGNNDDGQCNVSGWKDIVDIAAFNNTTAGLRSDGTIVMTGKNEGNCYEAKKWKNIKRIFAGSSAIVGITESGTAVTTNKDWKDEIENWRDIVNVSVSSGIAVGVEKIGYVNVVCDYYDDKRTEFRKKLQSWTNIIDVEIDWDLDYYAIGLRSNGKLVSASTDGSDFSSVDKRIDILGIDDVMTPEGTVAKDDSEEYSTSQSYTSNYRAQDIISTVISIIIIIIIFVSCNQ